MSTSYREYLKEALEKKEGILFPSVRSFAIRAGISVSHLSRVLSGKKDLSEEMALKVASELQMTELEKTHFLDLVSLEKADVHTRQLLTQRIRSRDATVRRKIDPEVFKVISDWHYFPIVELTRTKGFRADPQWIARKLGISSTEAQVALQRLQAVGILSVNQDGRIFVAGQLDVETSDDIALEAIQKHHEQMSQKAIAALGHEDVKEREFQSMQIAFRDEDMHKAKLLIREFVDKFESEFKPLPGENVYQMNVQFFNLTSNSKKV